MLAFLLVPLVTAYHRPASLDEALDLLSAPRRVALGGGTTLNADREPSGWETVPMRRRSCCVSSNICIS